MIFPDDHLATSKSVLRRIWSILRVSLVQSVGHASVSGRAILAADDGRNVRA